jgi:hypothetical protein
MKRTDIYRELIDLANSLDEHVTPGEVALALLELTWTLEPIEEFESEDEDSPGRFQVGDLVRLTGKSWDSFDLRGKTARVHSVTSWAEPEISDPDGKGRWFSIYVNSHYDYSAERVEDE